MASRNMWDNNSAQHSENSLGFYSWDVQNNKVYGDDVIAYVFGVDPVELTVGLPIEILLRYIDDGDKQRLAKEIHDAILSGFPFQSEYGLTHPGGNKVRVKANGRCLRDAEGVPSIYGGTVNIQMFAPANDVVSSDPLESYCRAALGLANNRHHTLAARYLSSALHVLRA